MSGRSLEARKRTRAADPLDVRRTPASDYHYLMENTMVSANVAMKNVGCYNLSLLR